MRLLVDTHLLLWLADDSPWLPAAARAIADDASHDLWFSVVSIWEVALKRSRHRADFEVDAALLREGLIASDYGELALTGTHVLGVVDLPPIHGDPYDRMLVAQARAEGLTLLTSDRTLAAYGPPVRLV